MWKKLSAIPDPSFVIDTNGVFLYVNRALSEFYQQPVHDIVGKGIYDFPKNLTPEKQVQIQ